LSLEDAEENYLAWTNTLLTNARTNAKRGGHYWAYVQCTERQHKTRNHPHSHIITTFCPDDAVVTKDDRERPCLVSEWFVRANASAGLGSQHKITSVQNASAVSRYVAKYMFKDTALEQWPPHWKRVRYSQNWPPLPDFVPDFSVALRSKNDWKLASEQPVNFEIANPLAYDLASHHIANIHRAFDLTTGEKVDNLTLLS